MRKVKLLVAAGMLSLALLPGCGRSSTNPIPLNEEVFYQHTELLDENNILWSSGYNAYGELGNGNNNNQSGFAPVSGLGALVGYAAGSNHVVAFSSDTIWTWGYNSYARLGVDPSSTTYKSSPMVLTIPGAQGTVQGVGAGSAHSLALVGGSVYAWGINNDGELGTGSTDNNNHFPPAPVVGANGQGQLSNIKKIAAGGLHSLALDNNGTVYGWGRDDFGQAGQAAGTPIPTPSVVNGITGTVTDIAAAGSYSLALAGGTVWAWGFGGYGELGNNTFDTGIVYVPVQVQKEDRTPLTGVTKISAGELHTLAIVTRADGKGEVWSWGFNEQGELGTGFKSPVPGDPTNANGINHAVQATILQGLIDSSDHGVTDVYAFGTSSFVRIDGKDWYGWGDNGWGQLGQPVAKNALGYLLTPVLIGKPGL